MCWRMNCFNNHQIQSHFSIDVGRFENIGILRENKDLIRTQFLKWVPTGTNKDPVGYNWECLTDSSFDTEKDTIINNEKFQLIYWKMTNPPYLASFCSNQFKSKICLRPNPNSNSIQLGLRLDIVSPCHKNNKKKNKKNKNPHQNLPKQSVLQT